MTSTDDRVVDLFTKISYHRNVSVVYLTQNIFYKNKQSRTLSLNSHFPWSYSKTLAMHHKWLTWLDKCILGRALFMIEAFKNATSAPYGYLLIDLKQETDDKLRLRTGRFPYDDLFVYVGNNNRRICI